MMEICRACLSTKNDINLINLDEELITNYNLLTNLNITILDGLPQYLCVPCREVISQFVKFREKCVLTESSLKSISTEIKVELPIKIELNDVNIEDHNPIKEELLNIDEYDVVDSSDLLNSFDNTFDNDHEYVDDTECNEFLRRSNRRIKKVSGKENTKKESNKVKKRLKTINAVSNKTNAKKENMKVTKSLKTINTVSIKTNTKKGVKVESDSNINIKDKPLINAEDDSDLLPCGLCPNNFNDKTLLRSHIESHKKDLSCEFCFEDFIDWPHIVSHRISHITVKKKATCPMCWKSFRRDIYLEYHFRTTHCDDMEFNGLKCKFCQTNYYSTPLKLRKHIERSHTGVLYICNICSKSSSTKQTLKSHMKIHSSEKKYVCDLCGASYRHRGGLVEHRLRKHAPEKHECKHCTRLFPTKDLLDKHTCTQLFICPVCGKESLRKDSLNRHIRSHSEERPYACDRCPAKYKSKMALQVHKDRHDGNRTRKCEYCSAKFYSLPVLIKHRRIHTGEKPYVCKVCQKGFTGRNNLKVHMKVHGEYLVVKKTIEVKSDK